MVDLKEEARRRLGWEAEQVAARLSDERAQRFNASRALVIEQLRHLKTLKCVDERRGQNWSTAEAGAAQLTVTMSVREALALVQVTGPISALNTSGPMARLLCAMHIAHRQLTRACDGWGAGGYAALQVLQAAVTDCLAYCEPMQSSSKGKKMKKPRQGEA